MNSTDNTVRVQNLNCCIASKALDIAKKLQLGIDQNCNIRHVQILIAMKEALECFLPNSGEVLSEGDLIITGGNAGTMTPTVDGRNIGSAAAVNADPKITAHNIVTGINTFGNTRTYSATRNEVTVEITAAPGTGSTPNGLVVSYTATVNGTATTENMAGGVDGDVDSNCLTQEEVDKMWDYVSKECEKCFAPYNSIYS